MVTEATERRAPQEELQLIQQKIAGILTPWIKTETVDFLPRISVKELWRQLRREAPMTAGQVYNVLRQGETIFDIGQEKVEARISLPTFLDAGTEVTIHGHQINQDYLASRVSFVQQTYAQRNER